MKAGTQVKLSDGRIGTVVFNGLIGVGIKWGKHTIDPEILENTYGDLVDIGVRTPELTREQKELIPDALLRTYSKPKLDGLECVGNDYEIIYVPEN